MLTGIFNWDILPSILDPELVQHVRTIKYKLHLQIYIKLVRYIFGSSCGLFLRSLHPLISNSLIYSYICNVITTLFAASTVSSILDIESSFSCVLTVQSNQGWNSDWTLSYSRNGGWHSNQTYGWFPFLPLERYYVR